MAALAEKVDEERLLAERLAQGQERAFDEVVERFSGDVRRLARRLLGWRSEADVEDVAQEAMIRVYLKRRTFRGMSSIRTWLTRITVNQCHSLHRRRVLRLEALWRAWRRAADAPIDAAARDELQARVRAAVCTLGQRDREVVVLHYLEELPVEQVAHIVGSSAGAVMVRLHRARKRLAEVLAPPESRDHG